MSKRQTNLFLSQNKFNIINILSASFAQSIQQVMDPRFFLLVFMAYALCAWAIKGRKNLGPKLAIQTLHLANKRYYTDRTTYNISITHSKTI